MKRKTSTVPTQIWTFGCLPPTTGGELVHEQHRKAHAYYNTLIEIELERRAAYRAARSAFPDLAPLEAEHKERRDLIAAQRELLKKAKVARHNKQKETPEVKAQNKQTRAEIKALQKVNKELYARLKATRKQLAKNPVLLAASATINEHAKERVHQARATCGVFWGTYLLVEKAIEAAIGAARKKAKKAKKAQKAKNSQKPPMDPGFRRWDGDGRVGVQIHGRLTTRGLVRGEHSFLQMDALPEGQWDTRSGRRHAWSKVRVRVGSEDNRAPVFAEFPVLLHRPLPDGVVKWAWIKISRIGTRTRYELQLVMESMEFARRRCGVGTVGLDLGWRKKEDGGIRVACTIDNLGKEEEYVLPAAIGEALAHCDTLKSHQDRWFNLAKRVVAEHKAALPEEFAKEVTHIANWKSPGRMTTLVRRWTKESGHQERLRELYGAWKVERLAAGQDLMDSHERVTAWLVLGSRDGTTPALLWFLHVWQRKNNHLYDWLSNQRDKALARRKDIFRNWAAQLSARYETLVIEEFDLRRFARDATPEEDASSDYVHRQRNEAAPGECREVVVEAFGARRVVEVDAVDSTKECDACGHVNDWPSAERRKLVLHCSGCGRDWDQDRNAARVLLRRHIGGERPSGGENTGPARGPRNHSTKAA